MAQRVRAHAVLEPGAPRVALDDLVEALARERAAAAVDEQRLLAVLARLGPVHENRAPASEVVVQRVQRVRADRHDALLRALAARTQQPLLLGDVRKRQADHLRDAQAAGVHELEQRPVAQRERSGPARRGEQMRDLLAREHPRQPLALSRTAQLRGGIVCDRAFAAQVAVEGA